MRTAISAALLAAFLTTPSASFAQAPEVDTFMGVAINQPFDMPLCMDKKRDQSRTCYWGDDYFTQSQGLNKGPRRGYKISVPVARLPPIMLASESWVGVRNGQVVSITSTTLGVVAQDQIFQLLKEKYGEPAEKLVRNVRNGFGQEAAVVNAIWRTPSLEITFLGAIHTMKTGEIKVETRNEATQVAKEIQARESAAPKF